METSKITIRQQDNFYTSIATLIYSRMDMIAVAVLVLATLLVTIPVYQYSYDDAYITYRYSYNMATGHGFVYTPGERHLGTTAPLYGLILGILGIPAPDLIPAISGWLSGISLFATGLAFFIYARRRKQPLVGLLAALPFLFNPIMLETFGGEVITQTALIMWAFVAYDAKYMATTGFLIGLATLMRGDGIIPLGVIGLHYLITQRRIPLRMGVAFLVPLLAWIGYSYSQFGSLLPDTLSAKVAQGESGHWLTYLGGLWYVAKLYLGPDIIFGPASHPLYRIYIFLAMPGMLAVLLRSRYWLLPLSWAALHIAGYTILKVPFYHWYFSPFFLALSIVAGAGLGALPALMRKWIVPEYRPFFMTMAIAASMIMVVPLLWDGGSLAVEGKLATQNREPAWSYRAVADWLVTNTPVNATVGYLEVGYIGYYSHRVIIDPLGLVTPGTTSHIRDGDIAWAYRTMLPDYIVSKPAFNPLLSPYQQEPWFATCYNKVATVEQIDIYKRCPVVPDNDKVVLVRTQPHNDVAMGELLPNRTIGQTFTAQQNDLRSIGLLLANYDKKLQGPLIFHLQYAADAGTNKDIATVKMDLSAVENNSWKLINFQPVADSAGKKFYMYLEAPQTVPGKTITAWASSTDRYPGGELMIGHTPAPGDLTFILYYLQH